MNLEGCQYYLNYINLDRWIAERTAPMVHNMTIPCSMNNYEI